MTMTLPSPDAPQVPPPDIAAIDPKRARRLTSVLVVTGFVANLGLRVDHPALGGVLALGAAIAATCFAFAASNRRGLLPFVGAFILAAPLAFRTSPWLIMLDVPASLSLIVIGVVARSGVRPWVSLRAFVTSTIQSLEHAMSGRARVFRSFQVALPRGLARRLRVVVAASPVVIVVGLLLVSADALFASFFRAPIDGRTVAGHVMLTVVAGLVLALPSAMTQWSPDQPVELHRPTRGAAETLAALWGTAVLLAGFASTQAFAALAGRDFVERRVGLTYKEYARGGFFQLLAVSAIVLVLLSLARRYRGHVDPRRDRTFLLLGWVVAGLVLVVVAVSIQRIRLYNQEFGLTMLRLYSMTFAGWLAIVVVVAMVALARPRATWIVVFVGATAFAGLLGMNLVNPEQIVVRYNLTRVVLPDREMHSEYLLTLSDDSIPELLTRLESRPRPGVLEALCDRVASPGGVMHWNWSTARANAALKRHCAS